MSRLVHFLQVLRLALDWARNSQLLHRVQVCLMVHLLCFNILSLRKLQCLVWSWFLGIEISAAVVPRSTSMIMFHCTAPLKVPEHSGTPEMSTNAASVVPLVSALERRFGFKHSLFATSMCGLFYIHVCGICHEILSVHSWALTRVRRMLSRKVEDFQAMSASHFFTMTMWQCTTSSLKLGHILRRWATSFCEGLGIFASATCHSISAVPL